MAKTISLNPEKLKIMKILVIDNYDSFTYNLVHAVKKITGLPVTVCRNDEIELKDINEFDKIILSPGTRDPFRSRAYCWTS